MVCVHRSLWEDRGGTFIVVWSQKRQLLGVALLAVIFVAFLLGGEKKTQQQAGG